MIQVYQFQLQQVNAELVKTTAKADAFETKYLDLREKNYELKKDLALIGDRHKLEATQKEIESQNTLGSLAKEFRPEIQELIAHVANKDKEKPKQLGDAEETQNSAILLMMNELDDETFGDFFEIMGRLGQVGEELRTEILNKLKASTTGFNDAIVQLNQLKRR